jgi:elongation factor G
MAYNPTTDKKERIGRLIRVYADHREDVKKCMLAILERCWDSRTLLTGDTVCEAHHPIVLERISSRASYFCGNRAKTTADNEKMEKPCSAWRRRPTFRVHEDENTGQTIIEGWVSFIWRSLLIACSGIQCTGQCWQTGVSYRETITKEFPKWNTNMSNKPWNGQYGHGVSPSNHYRRVVGWYLSTRSEVVPFRVIISRGRKRRA